MSIQMCGTCKRIKVAEDKPWSAQPSTKINANAPNVEIVEECDVCGGAVPMEPSELIDAISGDTIDHNPAPEETAIVASKEVSANPPEMTEEFAKEAHENHNALLSAKRLMGQSLLAFCNYLREMKSKEYYLCYADTWYEYLADPDIGIDDTRARRLIRLVTIKEALETSSGNEVDIAEISESRLTRDILPCIKFDEKKGEIKNEEEVKELLDSARSMGNNDWIAEVAKHKPTAGGKKAVEALIADGPVKNPDGDVVGYISSVKANEDCHFLKVKIDNSWIPEGPLVLHIQ